MSRFTSKVRHIRLDTLSYAFLGLLMSAPAIAYELVDLGPNVEPRSVSDTRVIVGASNTDQSPSTAFRWSETEGFETLDGTVANSVNDSEQITGSTVDGAFILDGAYRDWSGYGAYGNNAFGSVAGYAIGNNPYRATSLPFNPAVYDGRRWQVYDIAQLYSRGTRKGVYADRFILSSINDDGFAVGYKYRYGLSGSSAILIDTSLPVNSASDVTYLPVPYGGRAAAINNLNQVVGTSGSNSSAGEYAFAFLYDQDTGTLDNLGTLPSAGPGSEPGLSSYANDINDAGMVVGNSWLVTALTSLVDPSKYRAFLWENGEMTDLNELENLPADWLLTDATAINEAGDIVGTGLVNGIEHGFLLANGGIIDPPPTENLPPVAIVTVDLSSGKAPLLVQFNGEASYDSDGTIDSFSWDFNDGSYSTEMNPQHEFAAPGTYVVMLTVSDDDGKTANGSINIVVKKGRRKK